MKTDKAILFFALILMIILPSCADGQTKAADSAKYGKLFVEAINSESVTRQETIVREIFAKSVIDEKGVDRIRGLFTQLKKGFAPMKYHHTEVNQFATRNGERFSMHIFARKLDAETWSDFQVRLESSAPYKIVSLGFIAEVAEPVNLPNGGIENQDSLKWLGGYLDKLKKENDLSGSILIAKDDNILFEKYFGFADAERRSPITSATRFNVASGSKMFTALSIAQLYETGKLKYDDPITKYLGGYKGSKEALKINIRHLLTHTSGVSEYWTDATEEQVRSARGTSDLLKLVYQSGFDFAAGDQYRYSNSNFVLLGAIVQKLTGESFDSYVKSNILKPAKMDATGYLDYDSKLTANGLKKNQSRESWIEARHGMRGSSAGGAYSNVRDFLKFSRALKSNTFVSSKTFLEMVKPPSFGNSSSETYGYGFIIRKSRDGVVSYGHGGIADGVNFEFRYFPSSDITLVVFSNQNNGAYDDLRRNATKLISGER